MNEIKIYLEIKDMAVDENGNRCPAGMQISLETEKQVDYAGLIKNINIPGILEMAALNELVKPKDVKVITPEEYDALYGE